MHRNEAAYPIWIKFGKLILIGIPDIITCSNFGDDRLRGLGVAGDIKFCYFANTFAVILVGYKHFTTVVSVHGCQFVHCSSSLSVYNDRRWR